jgi:branched-subunit amino acid transport protein
MTTHSVATIWILMGVVALGTWLLRLSFIGALGRAAAIPDVVSRILRLIPPAVLAALVAPSLTHAAGSFDLGSARFAAGMIAGVVAWKTKHVLATIGAGMGVLWLLQTLGWS